MDKYIFRTFDEVRDWVKDNKLVRFNIRNGRPGSEDKNNYIFVYDDDATVDENLAVLERRLEAHAGLHLYGVGWRNKTQTVTGVSCEIQYGKENDELERLRRMMGSQGVGQMQPAVDEAALTDRIRRELTTEFELRRMEETRKDFERERKEFEAEKNGVIGALVNYFAPVAQAFMQQKGLAKVAGTNVEAERIVPADAPETETPDPDDLPDGENETAYALLCRFRKVEPDYLKLLESVVKMAESGDAMYSTAKQFLLK